MYTYRYVGMHDFPLHRFDRPREGFSVKSIKSIEPYVASPVYYSVILFVRGQRFSEARDIIVF